MVIKPVVNDIILQTFFAHLRNMVKYYGSYCLFFFQIQYISDFLIDFLDICSVSKLGAEFCNAIITSSGGPNCKTHKLLPGSANILEAFFFLMSGRKEPKVHVSERIHKFSQGPMCWTSPSSLKIAIQQILFGN